MSLGRGNGLQTARTPERVVSGLGPLWSGLIAAALVILTLWVAVALGMQEQELVAVAAPTATSTVLLPSPTPMPVAATELPLSTPQPTWTPSPEPSSTPSASPTFQPSPTVQTGCVPPADWLWYRVSSGETLAGLAERYLSTEAELMQVNCLTSRILVAGQRIYVPNVTPRQQGCVVVNPGRWVKYVIQPGDTLFSLAHRTGTDTGTLMRVNCLTSDLIVTGRTLLLPRLPSPPPTATRKPTAIPPSSTPTPTDNLTPGPTETEPVTSEPSPETPTAEPPTATAEPPTPTDTSIPPTATEPPTRPPEEPTATPVTPTATPGGQ
jgi:LysM repeat protein